MAERGKDGKRCLPALTELLRRIAGEQGPGPRPGARRPFRPGRRPEALDAEVARIVSPGAAPGVAAPDTRAQRQGGNLERASLEGARLPGANLREANLERADLATPGWKKPRWPAPTWSVPG